jgi:hypothetical protein
MRIKRDYAASHAVMVLEAGGKLQQHVIIAGVQHVVSDLAGFFNVDVEIPAEIASENRDMLTSIGFVHAGTLSTNNQTFVRLRKPLRRSSDGGHVTADHVLHPNPSPVSDAEFTGRQLAAKISTEGSENRAARIKADATMFDRPEPTLAAPTFVERANAAERSRIQAEIARLQQKPEGE